MQGILLYLDIAEVDAPESEVLTYKLHEITIDDPNIWLENADSNRTKAWIKQQNARSFTHFTNFESLRSKFLSQMDVANNFEIAEPPFHIGDRYFYFKKLRPHQSQFSLYSTLDLAKEGKLVFDSSKIRNQEGSNFCLVHGTWFSSDGTLMTYGYSYLDSPNPHVLHLGVRDLSRRTDLSVDSIKDVGPIKKISVSWFEKDSQQLGFFYTVHKVVPDTSSKKYGRQNFDPNAIEISGKKLSLEGNDSIQSGDDGQMKTVVSNRVYFHRLGTDSMEDLLIFQLSNERDAVSLNITITSDGHYLLVEAHRNAVEVSCNSGHQQVIAENFYSFEMGNKVYCFDLAAFTGFHANSIGYCMKLIDVFAYRFEYISNIEQEFWFRTNFRAPNFRVVRITLPDTRSDIEISAELEYTFLLAWKSALEWIPERPGYYLERYAHLAVNVIGII